MKIKKIPSATIARLPLYLRELDELTAAGEGVVSSRTLADRTGLTSEQIRKDLAYFGAFGTRGIGYEVAHLRLAILRILGLVEPAPVAVVGAGHLGTALIRYFARRDSGLFIACVFDADPNKQGTSVDGHAILAAETITSVVREMAVPLGVVAVPAPAAQDVFARLVEGGVGAVLNFAPVKLFSRQTFVKNLDLSTELQALAYYGRGQGGMASHDSLS